VGGLLESPQSRSGVVSFVSNRWTGTGDRDRTGDRVLVFQDREVVESDEEDTWHKGSGEDGSSESVVDDDTEVVDSYVSTESFFVCQRR
jgi:hypothetical protein